MYIEFFCEQVYNRHSMANPNYLSRRDFLKLTGLGAAVTAILTGCGPAVATQPTERGTEPLRPGEFSRKPFFMVAGEPTVMDDQTFDMIRAMSETFPLPSNELPLMGRKDVSPFIAHMMGDYIRVSMPYASGKNGIMLRGPASHDVSYQRDEVTSGVFFDKDRKVTVAVTDMTAPDPNDALTLNIAENKNWFFIQNKMSALSIPKEIDDNFAVRHTAEVSGMVNPHIPGDARFMHTVGGYLNLIGDVMTGNMQQQGRPLEEISEAIYKSRMKWLELVFSNASTVDVIKEYYRTDLGYNLDDPDVEHQIFEYVNYLLGIMDNYRETMKYVKTPEMAMAVLQSINVFDRLVRNPTDTEEQRAQKEAILNGYKQLVEVVDADMPHGDQGKGVWELKDMTTLEQEKKEFWINIPQEKPKAVIVQKKQDYVVNRNNDQGTPVPEIKTKYRTEVRFLYSTGSSILKAEERDGEVVQPGDYFSDSILTRATPVSQDEMKDQGYELGSEGWEISSIMQLDNFHVQLYQMPDTNKLQWAIEQKDSGPREALVSGDLGQDFLRLFSLGDTYYHQSLLLDNGKEFKGSPLKWAMDATNKWKELIAKGEDRATGFGLMSTQEFLSASSKGLLVPEDENIRNLFASLRNQEIIEKTSSPYSYGFVVTTNAETIPVMELSSGNIIGHFSGGDMFSYYQPRWIQTNEGKKPYLVIDPSGNYAIPLDTSKLQLIDSGLGEKGWNFVKAAFPWALAAFGVGGKIPGVIGKALKLLGIMK